ncbi:unnamed protein product [Pieris brassicae]|uniref:Uncharacterized protein n=1 Tax=Pieris brassicae TaxID=7116 RepID=A0A9P0TAX6_PIEBR|nr:unnamed protein product [Pieris brassicae]
MRSSPLIRWLVFRACPQSPVRGGAELTGSYLINPPAAAIGRLRAVEARPRVNWAAGPVFVGTINEKLCLTPSYR